MVAWLCLTESFGAVCASGYLRLGMKPQDCCSVVQRLKCLGLASVSLSPTTTFSQPWVRSQMRQIFGQNTLKFPVMFKILHRID